MKRVNQVLWGIILIGVGLLLGLNAFGITNVEIFFDGWWTLFIIVPCAMGLIFGNDRSGSLIGLCIGVFLLLCCQDILDFDMMWKLLLPAIIVLLGIKLIIGSFFEKDTEERLKRIKDENGFVSHGTAIFSGDELDFSSEVFQGAELTAVFGGVECDLRNAVIEQDCVIQATAIFGGIDIFVPNNINIKTSSISIFGGLTNASGNVRDESAPTLYIKGICIFGGVDIK